MTTDASVTAPQTYARVAGVLYLIIIVLAIFGEVFVRGSLIVSGDPTATAEKITSSELLWRVHIATDVFYLVCAVAMTLVFYVLLRPVHSDLALLATSFNLVAITLEAACRLPLLTTLHPLGTSEYLSSFNREQLNLLAYFDIRSHGKGFDIALVFFGCVCLVWGHLLFRSGYLPRVFGVLYQIVGVCYLVYSFGEIVLPRLALYPWIFLPAVPAEWGLCLWLLVKGVNVAKWEERTQGER
jgi:hypothetical protein